LTTEVPVGRANGLDHESVITCDNIATIAVSELGEQIGFLLDAQEAQLTDAITAAFDLED
jgi:mRNA interferase MazF